MMICIRDPMHLSISSVRQIGAKWKLEVRLVCYLVQTKRENQRHTYRMAEADLVRSQVQLPSLNGLIESIYDRMLSNLNQQILFSQVIFVVRIIQNRKACVHFKTRQCFSFFRLDSILFAKRKQIHRRTGEKLHPASTGEKSAKGAK